MADKEVSMHRLSKEDEQAIYTLISEKLSPAAGGSSAAKKDKQQRQERFEQFLIDNTPLIRNKRRDKGPRRLCYENLPEVLQITGLTYLDLLQCVSKTPGGDRIEPAWATPEEAAMCEYCDLLTDKQRAPILDLVRRLLPANLQSSERDLTPIQRLAKANFIRTDTTNETLQLVRELGIELEYRRRLIPYSYNALPISLVAYAGIGFDVSPHWLLGLDSAHTVLAAHGETEDIMDLFCFVPKSRQGAVLKAVKVAVERGGAAEV